MDEKIYINLIDEAFKVREKSYSPYSNFKVGASILVDDSKIFSGCNIENVSYGASNCAERTAIFKAVSEGYKTIKAICVIGSFADLTYPCGICRQVIIEFAESEDIPVIIAQGKDKYVIHKLKDIIPFGFSRNNLV